MSLHTWHRQHPSKPSSCAIFTLNSLCLGQSCHRQKGHVSVHTGSLQSCLTLDPEGSGEAETRGPSPKVHVLSPRALLGGDVLQCGDWT